MCSRHYANWRTTGDPLPQIRPNYGQKRRMRPDGYIDVWLPGHPMAHAFGYAAEHRVVAWDAGLLTDPADQVHHRDHDKTNNDLSNLEVKTRPQHALEHVEERGRVRNQFGVYAVKPRHLRQSAEKPARECPTCAGQLAASKRRDAVFCSIKCRNRHHAGMR